MRRKGILPLGGVAVPVLLALTGPIVASAGDTECIGLLPPGVYDNVIVPEGQDCFVPAAEIRGTLKALEASSLTTSNTIVRGNVVGDKAASVNVQISTVNGNVQFQGREGSKAFFRVIFSNVGGDIVSERGPNSQSIANTVGGNVHFKDGGADGEADVCQTTLTNGNIQVEKMIGAVYVGPGGFRGCAPNSVLNGNVQITDNTISGRGSLLAIRGNEVAGNLQVFENRGEGPKEVQGNTVGANLQCAENDPPFLGGPNVAQKTEGQCF